MTRQASFTSARSTADDRDADAAREGAGAKDAPDTGALPAGPRRALLVAAYSGAAGMGMLFAAWTLSQWPLSVLTSIDRVFRAVGVRAIALNELDALEQRRYAHEVLTEHARTLPPCPDGVLLRQQHGDAHREISAGAAALRTPVLEIYWRTTLVFPAVLTYYRTALPAAGWVLDAPAASVTATTHGGSDDGSDGSTRVPGLPVAGSAPDATLDAVRAGVQLVVERPEDGDVGLSRPVAATHILSLRLMETMPLSIRR